MGIFGENLNSIMEKENLTYKKFAERLGYDRERLSQLCSGSQDIALSTASRIAQRTNYSVSALFSNSFKDDSNFRSRSTYEAFDVLEAYLSAVSSKMNAKRMTRAEIADKTDMDKASLTRILNGQIRDPRISTLSIIADAIESSLSDMFRKEQV